MKNSIQKIAAAVGVSAILISLPVLADQPGKGWDNFSSGAGEPIAAQSATQARVALNGMPGKGWDNFSSGAGEPIAAQSATQARVALNGMPGKGWDNFSSGAGEPIAVSRDASK